jgi:hypothetical protein
MSQSHSSSIHPAPSYKEEIVSSEAHASYSVYKLALDKRADTLNISNDWFDHIRYGREVEPILRKIAPPKIA